MATPPYLRYSASTHRIYDVTFDNDHITTTLTHSAPIVEDWIEEIQRVHRHRLHKLIVGLDVEWRPNFNNNSRNPVATLQLCVGRRCLIFQLIYSDDIPQSLIAFLDDDDYTFVGVGIDDDIQKLEVDYNLSVYNAVDLRYYAANAMNQEWLRNVGLKVLADEVLGREVDKPRSVTLSRWDDEWLSLGQVKYACIDAFLSFEIGRHLMS